MFHNYDHALLGRIWICGNPGKVSIDIIHSMDQAILCHVTALKDNYSFLCSDVYASNNYIDRRVLWRHLQWCGPKVGQNPWMVIGDFYTTRFVNEKSGGNMVQDTAMNDFHECLFNLELADVPFLGPIFTWMNRREGVNFIARKLDRCLQNEYCLDMFPNALTEVQHPGLSDHCPLVTSLNVRPVPERRKNFPFKIFNFWADHSTFLEIVKEVWESDVHGTPNDTVSWGCIMNILSCMGTPTHLLRCIKACITTPSFSISINGELARFFASKRGLRQGDPLSSFLFIITMEAFSRSLAMAASRQGFQFHPRCKEINLTHLCFADDMFLFSGGTLSSVQVYMDELNRFACFLGLQVNNQKSAIFIAGVSDEVRNDLVNITGFSLGRFPMTYLGVPLISTRLTHSDCMALLQRITARIQSWTSKSLSYAGRL